MSKLGERMVSDRISVCKESTQNQRPAKTRWLHLIALLLLFSFVALPRILPFSPTFLTYDEMKIGTWVSEMTGAMLAGDWQRTAIANNPYPAVTLAWLEVIQAKTLPLLSGQTLTNQQFVSASIEAVVKTLPRRRLVLAWLNVAVIAAQFWFLQRFYNAFIAVTTTLLLAFDPFLLTESRTFRAEGLTTGLMLLSALSIIYYTKERRGRWLVMSGIVAGLATLTRVSAFFLFPFAGLTLMAWPLLVGQRAGLDWLKQTVRDGLLWLLVMAFTFVVLWPALWLSPAAGPSKLYAAIAPVLANTGRVWEKGVFFQGQTLGDVDPGPLFYLWALAYRSTPVMWIGWVGALVGAVWFVYLIVQKRRSDKSASMLRLSAPQAVTWLIGAFVFFYFVAINLSATKIDRYLVAMWPGLSVIAALGFELISQRLATLGWREPVVQSALWAGILLLGLFLSWPHHPYYTTYWNPLLGGGQAAVQVLPAMGRQGVDGLIADLNELPGAERLNLAGTGLDLDGVQECPAIFVGHCLGPNEFLAGDYFLNSIYSIQNEILLANVRDLLPGIELAQTFHHTGVDYVWLYKMPDDLHYVGHWLDRESGSFSGYRLPKTEIRAGQSVQMTLFWQNGETSGWRFDDSELFVKVLDQTGRVRFVVPATLQPDFRAYLSQPNEILPFTAPLDFPPETTLGGYTLAVGLRVKETGVETLAIPLVEGANRLVVNGGAILDGDEILSVQHPLAQTIDGRLRLLGYDTGPAVIDDDLSEPPSLSLWWQAKDHIDQAYTLSLTLRDDRNQIVAEWRDTLAPDIHPLTAWQPGEVVKRTFSLELGSAGSTKQGRFFMSVFSGNGGATEPLLELPLAALVQTARPQRPPVGMQHRFDDITFAHSLDLLGYDLHGRSKVATGQLFVTLYWLNRNPLKPMEARLEILAENGDLIAAQQSLPIPASANDLSWQSISHYEFTLARQPASIVIKVKPVGSETWLTVDDGALSSSDAVVIGDILSKTVLVGE